MAQQSRHVWNSSVSKKDKSMELKAFLNAPGRRISRSARVTLRATDSDCQCKHWLEHKPSFKAVMLKKKKR
jgi:hypothetical protein